MRIGMRLLLGYFYWWRWQLVRTGHFVKEVKPGVRRATEGR